METVGVNTLRKNLAVLLKKVEKGESIAITSQGHEIALVIPPESKREKARRALEELRKTAFEREEITPKADETAGSGEKECLSPGEKSKEVSIFNHPFFGMVGNDAAEPVEAVMNTLRGIRY